MPTITLQQWTTATQAVSAFKQSDTLKEVTRAFGLYTQRQTTANLELLAGNLQLWRTTGPLAERTTLATDATDLQTTITTAQATNQVINVKASNVGQSSLYDLITPLRADMPAIFGALGPAQCLPAFTPTEIAKINEAFRRARRAAELARDAAIQIAAKTALQRPMTATEALFVEYFGAFDQTRARQVLANYKDIVDAFDTKVMLYDIRNTPYGMDCYAACEVGRITRTSARQQSQVTSRVTMVMGRAFFTESIPKKPAAGPFNPPAAYDKTSDATVGTFVHEMSHGSFHAVDAPKVNAANNWELAPDLTAGDDYGASPDNDEQSSTPLLDKRLALKDPSVAIRNADNYGQFAREVADL
jgi:hypothetical protein